jgi:signal transduction histidine kinase
MALVLGATGVFIYLRFSAELDATINSGLRSRASDVGAAPGAVRIDNPEAREEALKDLVQLLFLGGPVALLLASLAAYWVAAAALRPVEAMRSQAAEISAAHPDKRLPVPSTGDEIARLGTTLNAMLERLGEALEHERSFVADASHELRTPLAILRTELELALAKGRSPAELQAALASAAEETDRLTQLSEDLLTIAQTERGELPLRLGRVKLDEVFEGVARRFARRAGEEGRSIAVAPNRDDAFQADRLRLDQAIGSMVDNALRYGWGPIDLEAGEEGGWTEIHVLDRGPGFAEQFLEHAFERFSRGSPSDRDGGSGLGLAIVQTIARAHGGDALAANRPGGGADVWLRLPARRASHL